MRDYDKAHTPRHHQGTVRIHNDSDYRIRRKDGARVRSPDLFLVYVHLLSLDSHPPYSVRVSIQSDALSSSSGRHMPM